MIDVLVTGRSLSAAQTALDLAEVGLSVAVAQGLNGGENHFASVQRAERDSDGHIAAFFDRIAEPLPGTEASVGAGSATRTLPPAPALLRGATGEWLPQSSPEVLGVPAVPLAAQSIRLLGGGAAFRAYLDRIMPLLTVGKTRLFGELVRKRMGRGVLKRLVEPQVYERYGVFADQVEAAIAAPGLNEAMSRAGALTSAALAYADRNVTRETRVLPAEKLENLHASVIHRLTLYGVSLLDSEVESLRSNQDEWVARMTTGEEIRARAAVIDHGDSLSPGASAMTSFPTLHPAAYRVTASAEIERPAWLPSTERHAVTEQSGWGIHVESDLTVASVGREAHTETPGERGNNHGDDERSRSAGVRVFAASARQPYSGSVPVIDLGGVPSELEAVLQALEIRASDGAGWQVRLEAAPFITQAERDAAASEVDAFMAEHPLLQPVGRSLHGNDLGAALADAHRRTVALRRKLLGLEARDD